mmetsp:Transcript_60708/g.131561  ORF Transcript_60708/g.131561 Transcript_60708/m.131561 type:complete len:227 (-) Transcript_60708:58-738(-)
MAALKGLVQKCTGGLLGRASETPQFLILGLDGVGKTTLLYRLKLGQLEWSDMKEDLARMRQRTAEDTIEDAGYHYEEFGKLFNYGMWEVPGTAAMRALWSVFYRSIRIHGVIFVVDPREEDSRVDIAKKNLHFLMSEDELRQAVFVVIVNQRYKDAAKTKRVYDEAEDELEFRLGLHDMHPSCKWRCRKFVLDCSELKGETDKKWVEVLEFLKAKLTDTRGYKIKL